MTFNTPLKFPIILFTLLLIGSASFTVHTLKGEKKFKNVNELGIYGDSTKDQSSVIQEAINHYENLYFPEGAYKITKSIQLNSNQHIKGEDSLTTFLTSVKNKKSKKFNFFVVNGKEQISISNLNFKADDIKDQSIYSVFISSTQHLSLTKLKVTNCGIIKSYGGKNNEYKSISDSFYKGNKYYEGNAFITIDSCTGIGSQNNIPRNVDGVLLYYASDWKITNSFFKRYNHGIQWWGGDSNYDRDGKINNLRKAKNGIVEKVTVTNVIGGGIWGSMGKNIIVKNCNVSHCGDVGIDFEGCFNAEAFDNIIRDCKNGALATFFLNKDISFRRNRIIQTKPKFLTACIYNSTLRLDNDEITFEDNTFISTNGISVIKQLGPAKNIRFTGNQLENVALNFTSFNNHQILVEDNTFNFDKSSHLNYVIKAGLTVNNGRVNIKNNQIITKVDQPKKLNVIHIQQSDPTSKHINRVTNNTIDGFFPDNYFAVEWSGKGNGTASTTYFKSSEKIDPKVIEKIEKGSKNSIVYFNNKRY